MWRSRGSRIARKLERTRMKVPYILSAVLAVLMVLQSTLGRVCPGLYRDAQWIRLTWFGND